MTEWVEDSFPEWIKEGAWFTTHRGKYHVRGFVDGHMVVKTWRESKQYWNYELMNSYHFFPYKSVIKDHSK